MIEATGRSSDRSFRLRISSNPRARCAKFDWRSRTPDGPLTDPIAIDIAHIARALHLVDRSVRRNRAIGKRMRRLDVIIPVQFPTYWSRDAAELEDILSFVSADDWRLRFVRIGANPRRSLPSPPKPRDGVVALFSGGLDSLCGAAVRAADPGPTCFVTHAPPGQRKVAMLLGGIWSAFGRRDVFDTASFMLRPLRSDAHGRRNYFPETTRRTRPIYFLLLAVATARQLGMHRIQMSENGALAMNLPFRSDAHGGTVARQAHIWMLGRATAWLDKVVPMAHPWIVSNPLYTMTKGDSCRLLGPASRFVHATLSCEYVGQQAARVRGWIRDHPRAARAVGSGPQCGACLPCVVRRSALLAAGIDDPNDHYFFDAPEIVRLWSRDARPGFTPPLLEVVASHPIYLSQFAEGMLNMDQREFVIRYLADLRQLAGHIAHPLKLPADAFRLARRFAAELSAFLVGEQ